jgi:hypothetical protein
MLVTSCDILGLVDILTRQDAKGGTHEHEGAQHPTVLMSKFVPGHQLPDLLQPVGGINPLLDRFDVIDFSRASMLLTYLVPG